MYIVFNVLYAVDATEKNVQEVYKFNVVTLILNDVAE